jgi:molecular chaperone DnaK
MRNKIDYGIDLGTTNSAIARMENGIPTIKKSDTLKDTLPSCVHYNKRQDILVGDTAFNVMKNDNIRALKTFEKGKTNTYIEFKRTMGTTHTYESSHMNKELTSEELSAEVLKKLKSFILDENISSIVITVPAKFLNPQNDATVNAAKLAGFKQVQLLQEPVAAATAYGLGSSSKDGYWLVFDFGGGTFDAALVKADEGILSVKDTDGDNWLGGKNLDEAIVDQLIIPYLKDNYSIDSIIQDNTKREILRNAVKPFAEEAKIQLSFKDAHNILSNLGDLPFEDDNGEEPEIDITVTQKEMENVVAPIFQKAIEITKSLLKRNNLKGADLGALILVGGPTYSPILRRMLKEQVTENVDTSVDPMTVVAKGACLFASTISVSDDVKEETRDKTKLQIDLKYEATTVELEEMVNIKVLKDKSIGEYPDKIFAEVIRVDGAWSSGKKLIGEKATIVDVVLMEGRSNSFEVNIYDESGNKLECQPNQFSILQGIGGLDGMQVLPYNIGIGKWFKEHERDGFMPARGLDKNKRIPAVGIINNLHTRSDIRPGMVNDKIRIPIYQGNYGAEGSSPALNNLITEVIISGESIPKFLPSGSPVEITIKVDKSQIMQFSAYFPTIDFTEELEIDIKKGKPQSIEEIEQQLASAKMKAQQLGNDEAIKNIEILKETFDNKKGSEPGRMEVQEGLRKELFALEDAEKFAQWPKVEAELKDSFFELEKLFREIKVKNFTDSINIDKVESQIQEFKKGIEHVIMEKNIKDAKNLISDIDSFDFNLRNIVTGNGMDVQYLKQIDNSFEKYHWKDRNKARQLCNQGLQLIAEGNTGGVRPILRQLIDLMPDDEKGTDVLG